jgi:FkbM family methyltransferase
MRHQTMSKYLYYLRSIPTLLGGFRRPGRILGIFLGLPGTLPSEVQLRNNGWRFSVRSALDVWVIKETCIDNGYLEWKTFDPAWSVIDVGAGLGDFTVLAAAACPKGQVHAYEPHEQSHQLLKNNLALNNLDGVHCYQEAVGNAGQKRVSQSRAGEPISTPFVETDADSSIPWVSLDQMVARLSGHDCDLLKIDCEGCEYELLLNASTDSLKKVRRITMETHDGYQGNSTDELAAYLSKRGFTVSRETNPVHPYLSLLYAER